MKNSCFTVANLILCWLVVTILLPDDKVKFPSPNFGYPKVNNMHIWNLISEHFKRFARPFWRTKIFIQGQMLASSDFSTVSHWGRTKSFIMVIFVIENENLIMYGENLFHFKVKYLKPCDGFKPNACEGMSFSQNWEKGCPTVTTAN